MKKIFGYFKRLAFFAVAIPVGFIFMVIQLNIKLFAGIAAVVDQLMVRFEMWAFNIPADFLSTDKYMPIGTAFVKAFNDTADQSFMIGR